MDGDLDCDLDGDMDDDMDGDLDGDPEDVLINNKTFLVQYNKAHHIVVHCSVSFFTIHLITC